MISRKKLSLGVLLASSMAVPAHVVAQESLIARSSAPVIEGEELIGAGLPVLLLASLAAVVGVVAVATSGDSDEPGSP